jgi:hypothetical protein
MAALSPRQLNYILLHIQLEVLYWSNYFFVELILLLESLVVNISHSILSYNYSLN